MPEALKGEVIDGLRACWLRGVKPRVAAVENRCCRRTAYYWYARFSGTDTIPRALPKHHYPVRPPIPMPDKPNAYPDVMHKLTGGRA